MTLFPDYQGGSIVNLMSSIIAACGGEATRYPVLRNLDADCLTNARNVILCVIDGLGYDYLIRHGKGSSLYQHLHSRIHAVAPATTAASITTYLTGLAPQQHGLTGWYTWFRELGSVVTVLPFLARCNRSDLGLAGITPQTLFGHQSVFDLMSVSSYSISPEWIARSVFNQAHLGKAGLMPYRDLQHYIYQITDCVRRHDNRKYIYAYWPGFDSLAHEYGVNSSAVADHFALLDEAFQQLTAQLSGTESVVLLSADHGFVDAPVERQLDVNSLPDLQQCLQIPLCGEPRLAYCYVRNGMQQRFVDSVQNELAHIAELYPSQHLIERGLYGLGERHPELASRVGDFTLVMKENYVLTQRLPGERAIQMTGFHGGLSSTEIEVPLILVRC